ncbi:hypothetical protein TELCIR_02604 [Teladorsagia circumcincta]|uniref:PHD-type domain-containing protein n=1 Tax=Teladorsagia circumcincta TaxID=45464 RepID=A0A2G9V074_TELCI|nr:hypothetical protein TELCIR_02604 [Teladorsagia circumcincta]
MTRLNISSYKGIFGVECIALMDEQNMFCLCSPVRESVARCPNDGIIKSNHVYKKSMTASEYRKLAHSSKYRNPYPDLRGKDLELQYFKTMFISNPIYGADTEGSFYDEGVEEFNMKKLETILDETKDATGGKAFMRHKNFMVLPSVLDKYKIPYEKKKKREETIESYSDVGGKRRRTSEGPEITGSWLCFRCKDRNDVAIRGTSCHLCELRGGALLPCRAGADICAFVHTVCAIFNRRTVFNDANNPTCCYTHPPVKQTSINGVLNYLPKDYVFEMGDDYESSRFQCDLCGHSREGLLRCSACDENGDPVLAHATCARQAGFLFERRNYPQVTVMICDRHQKSAVGPLMDVNLGDIVIAWMDGGSRVKVQWSDGEVYDGYYRCISKTIEYTVVFPNGTSARLPRADLYGADDLVPPEVRRRLRKSH